MSKEVRRPTMRADDIPYKDPNKPTKRVTVKLGTVTDSPRSVRMREESRRIVNSIRDKKLRDQYTF